MADSAIKGISTAGDVVVESITLQLNDGRVINLNQSFIDVQFYEDIFSNFITGQIAIADGYDLIAEGNLTGGELLQFKLSTPAGNPSDRSFIVDYTGLLYKISSKIMANQHTQLLVLHFTSPESFTNEMKKVSKYFEGSIADNVHMLFTKSAYLGSNRPVRIENPANKLKFASPFWTPAKIINWFATRSLKSSLKIPDFVFFETLTKGFQFTSLSSLYEAAPQIKYLTGTGLTHGFIDPADVEMQYSKILDIQFDGVFDTIQRAKTGFYNSRLMLANTVTKNFVSSTLDSRDLFKLYPHLNSYPGEPAIDPVPAKHNVSENAHLSSFINQQFAFNGQRDFGVKDWYGQRNYIMSLLNSTIKFDIMVNGRFDIGAGRKVHVDIEKAQIHTPGQLPQDASNKTLKGNYLVAACSHNIASIKGKARHSMTLQCITDSLAPVQPVENK